jgi:hypothetical protein
MTSHRTYQGGTVLEGLGGPVHVDPYTFDGIDPTLDSCCQREVSVGMICSSGSPRSSRARSYTPICLSIHSVSRLNPIANTMLSRPPYNVMMSLPWQNGENEI